MTFVITASISRSQESHQLKNLRFSDKENGEINLLSQFEVSIKH